MLNNRPEERVSTGFEALDDVLGGLYWGDNVVWQLESAAIAPFYRAISTSGDLFDTSAVVSFGSGELELGVPELSVLDASPRSDLAQPLDLLRRIYQLCHPPGRRLLLFESLDTMVNTWGMESAREFFARCCPLLLEMSAIAYWFMRIRDTPSAVRETVEAVTQCVLRVDEHSVRVAKAEGRDGSVRGAVLHWHEKEGHAVLTPAEVADRVAASLREIRRVRELSQHELGDLAGVSPSAISQAEHGLRGLSLSTLARLSSALGITIDDLLRGENPEVYRIGRRSDDPQHGFEHSITLVEGANSELWIDLVHLGARETGTPNNNQHGLGIVAIASGLVQLEVAGQSPAVRHGEVLVADSARVAGWRNLGQSDAVFFWIVVARNQPWQFRG